jgi:hypothetical protein
MPINYLSILSLGNITKSLPYKEAIKEYEGRKVEKHTL